MSAFVVAPTTMHAAVAAILAAPPHLRLPVLNALDIKTRPGDATAIGRRLYTLNIEAVQQRYPDTIDNPDDMPGCENCHLMPGAYQWETSLADSDIVAQSQGLGCLLYQCAEGDVPETEIYKALKRLRDHLDAQTEKMHPHGDPRHSAKYMAFWR